MPESIAKMLRALSQSNFTSELTLGAAKLDNLNLESVDLDTKVKLY
jgi:hypothetical protein